MPAIVRLGLVELLSFRQWWSICWIYKWMENGDLAFFLGFDEWVEVAVLEPRLNKCLAKIVAVFEEVEDTTLHVNHDANNTPDIKISKWRFWLFFDRIIVAPFLASIDITGGQVHAPKIPGARDVLIQIKCVPANAQDNFRVNIARIHDLVDSVLKVKYMRQLLERNDARLHRLRNFISMSIKVVVLCCR